MTMTMRRLFLLLGLCPALALAQSTQIVTKNGSGTLLPVSGTNPFRVDVTGTTTQPVSAASLPLPTGAATAALQPTLNAGGSTRVTLYDATGAEITQSPSGRAAASASGPMVLSTEDLAAVNARLAETTFTGRVPSGMTAPTSSPAGTEAGLIVRNIPSGTQTVSGTVAATQSGTWTVQPGNTANTTAWLVTGTGGVFPSTQSGTWTVQPGNTANTTPWLVTDSDNLVNYSTATSGVSTATTLTQVVAASGSNRTVIKNWKCSASAASTTTTDQQCLLKYGTGTNCGTGTTTIDGCFQAANSGCNGQEIIIPASQAVCWMHAAAGSKIVTVTYKQVP